VTTSVLIAGAGPAALETALGLRTLAADRVAVTLLAPDAEYVDRPTSVAVPFAPARVLRVRLTDVARDLGAALIQDSLASADVQARSVTTGRDRELRYDALVVATGAATVPAIEPALTFRGPGAVEAVRALVRDVRRGHVRRLAFVVPAGPVWPLPLYELALMTAERAQPAQPGFELHLVTPEAGPLAVFGPRASAAVSAELARAGIAVHAGARAQLLQNGTLELRPSRARLDVDRVIAVPRLTGRPVPGLPADRDGFLPVDEENRVRGADGVFAVGDATDFPIRQGGLATQQADAVAARIAAAAGAPVEPWRFRPVLRTMLLTGGTPLWLQYAPAGGEGEGAVAGTPLWGPRTKIAGRWLGPYLAARDPASHSARGTGAPGAV
jgi:sulfide:quinone oxidoreductase